MMTTARCVAIAVCTLRTIRTVPIQRGGTRISLIGSLLGIRNGYLYVGCEKMHGRRSVVG